MNKTLLKVSSTTSTKQLAGCIANCVEEGKETEIRAVVRLPLIKCISHLLLQVVLWLQKVSHFYLKLALQTLKKMVM